MKQTLDRLRSEFLEMPGLRLTVPQVQKLCGIESHLCRAVLDALVDAGFLTVDAQNRYARASGGPTVRPRPAKALLSVERHNARVS